VSITEYMVALHGSIFHSQTCNIILQTAANHYKI